MSLAFSFTRSTVGIDAQPVQVEIHLSNGLPHFNMVGLAETAVKESKDRVRSAIINSQFEFPCKKITVSLAPADLPKSGSGFDLPIAIGILAASGQIKGTQLANHEFIGELALSGDLRGVSAIIPTVLAASRANRPLIIPVANAQEAALAEGAQVLCATNLREVCSYLCHDTALQSLPPRPSSQNANEAMDWSEVKGQLHAKQALIIAACGGHSVLLNGPPGSGKTMLAQRFSTLLPLLNEKQALECAAIYSLRNKHPDYSQWRIPAFRAPHHTASPVSLVGGGNPPKPGEISLAHHGVLFLDELPEFSKHVLETLRQPLESGSICISRAAIQMELPARFQLIAAMNPCPCGQWGNNQANCLCSPDRINRYLSKLSAPLLDRIDMHIHVQALPQRELIKTNTNCSRESPGIRQQVSTLRALQIERQGSLNAALGTKECEAVCNLDSASQNFLAQAMETLKLSARAYYRLLKVARTVADMNNERDVSLRAIQRALLFKQTPQTLP